MQKNLNTIANQQTGIPLAGAQVSIQNYPSGTPATVYPTNAIGTPLTQPLTVQADGSFPFYAPDGHYQFYVNPFGGAPYTIQDVLFEDDGANNYVTQAEIAAYPTSAILAASSGSSLIGWIQSGIGAIIRTIQDKLREVGGFSVTDFTGTDPTGATSSVSGFNAAIVAANGGTMVINKGTYLIDSNLSIPAGYQFDIVFKKGALIKAGANNVTIFLAATNWYTSKVYNPQIDGNGFTGVTGFDLTHFVVGSSIVRPTLTNLANGIIARSLCYGAVIDTPDIRSCVNPIVVMDGSANLQIRCPQIDTFTGTAGIDIQHGTNINVGVEVIGGYIQNGASGVQDAAFTTKVVGTYFERCTVADVSLVSGSHHFKGMYTNHTSTGVVAYKGRSADSATIWRPMMSNSARSTGLFDFDGTNTNCVADYLPGNLASGYVNIPVGTVTGITTGISTTSGTFSDLVTAQNGIVVSNGASAQGSLRTNSVAGMLIQGSTGSSYDMAALGPVSGYIWYIPTGTTDFHSTGALISEQAIRLTNISTGELWAHGMASELLTLSTSGTTTDTSANLLPANAIIEAVVARVTTTITTATDWKLGDATTAGRFSAANSTMIAGTTQVGTIQADQTGAAGPRQVSAAKVRVTTTGTPGAGVIRITVFYRSFTAPTS